MRRVHIDHFLPESHVPLISVLAPLALLSAMGPDAPPRAVPAIASVQVSKTSLAGGGSLLVAITLTAQAPLGGSDVNLTYSNSTVLSNAPKGITIPNGQSSGTITLTTVPTATTVTVTVTGSLGASSASATVTVRSPQVQTASLPSAIQGGTTQELSVTTDGPAPAGGSLLHLSFTPNVVVPVPTTYTIDLGGSLFGCGLDVLIEGGGCTQTVTMTDSANLLVVPAGGTHKTIKLLVPVGREDRAVTGTVSLGNSVPVSFTIRRPRPTSAAFVASCSASATPITSVAGPAALQLRVRTSDRVAKSGAYVSLTMRSTTAVPPVTLELDHSNGTYDHFGCVPVPLPAVTQPTSLTITADGGGASTGATIRNVPLVVSSVVLSRDSVTSGTPVTATITMSAAAPSDATVQVSASNSTAAPIPASVTVVQGAPTATVNFVPRVPLTSVSPRLTVIISATYGGSTKADTLIVAR